MFSYAYRKEIDVLLLDEPDAHMHGNLQVALFKELLRVCEEQNKQVIIATHSARMVEESKEHLAEVDVIGMDLMGKGERVQPLKTAEAIERFLLGEIDEKAMDTLKPAILFVEGPTDQMVYEKVVETFFDGYKDKVEISSGGGCGNFDHWIKKAKENGKKYCIIADSNAKSFEDPNLIRLCSSWLTKEKKTRHEDRERVLNGEDVFVPNVANVLKIELESFYSLEVQRQFPEHRNQKGDKKKAAEYVASGKDMESLENFKPGH